MEIFKLFGSIFVNTDEADKSIQKTEKNTESFASKLGNGIKTAAKWGSAITAAATGVGAALVGIASKSASTADHIDKMSQKIGISREAYQELDFICSQSGTSVDNLQAGIKTLTSAMDGAKNGTAANVEQFERLGVAVTDADGSFRSQEDVFFDTIAALQEMDNQTEKARLATELFGKSGIELMPLLNGASGSIEEMRQQAHDLGLVLDDEIIDNGVNLTDSLDQTKRAFASIGTQLGGALMPIVEQASDYVQQSLPMIQGLIAGLIPIITSLLAGILPPLMNLAESIFPILFSLVEKLIPPMVQIVETVLPVIVQLIEMLLPPIIQIVEAVLPILVQLVAALLPLLQPILQLLQPMIDLLMLLIQPLIELLNLILPPLTKAIEVFASVLEEGISNALSVAWEVITKVFAGIVQAFQEIWETIKSVFDTVVESFGGVWDSITNIFNSIVETVSQAWETVKNAVEVALMFIVELVTAAFDLITLPFQFIWENCKEIILEAWENIKGIVSGALEAISTAISTVWEGIRGAIVAVLDVIKETFSKVWEKITSVVTEAVNAVKTVISDVFGRIKSTISEILDGIKSVFSTVWDWVKSKVSGIVNGIKSDISNGLNGAFSTVSNILGKIKEKFSSIFEGAKNIVSNAIEKIKGFFKFEWSLPKLKMPHLKISGSFSLVPPSVPSFSIDWYAKGGILKEPTIFGMNPENGNAMVGGEAGPEAVAPIETLQQYVKEAVAEQNAGLLQVLLQILQAITSLDDGLLDKLIEALESMRFEVREREFARLVREV